MEPTDDGLAYGAGFLSTSFSRAATKSRTIVPTLRTLHLSDNRLTTESLDGFKTGWKFQQLRLLSLDANFLDGTLGADRFATMPNLAELNLSANPKLRKLEGELPNTQVNMEGCNAGSSGPTQTTSEVAATDASTSSAPVRAKKDPIPFPEADLTVTYRTCPAATFESEPLNIDFDIYLPTNPAKPSGHPVLIWFHGGGLLQGNKENLVPHLRRLPGYTYPNGENVVVISPNYRLAPQVPIIDILSDVTALMAYINTKLNVRLEKLGKGDHLVDTSRICLSGGSAGGYLAMIAGLDVPRRATDQDVGGYRGERGSSGVKCIAPFYPITDLTDPFWATETNPVPWYGKV